MHTRGIGLFSVAAATGLLLSGCATEKYVDEQVAAVNTRVEALGGRVGALESRVGELGGRIDTVDRTAQQALQQANAATKLAEGKLVYSVLSESDSVTFDTNRWNLTDEAKATLTAFADRLKGDNKNVFIEIVGHGDRRGSVNANRILGEKRALEVRRFLYDQGIPINKMETVSWGEERQVGQGNSAETLEANRRVVLRVLG
jgi:outer membrane protein OmpA-like peptidoglycan-associated protein